eukprot:scaffold49220_cov57-Phaeocystis_antarctica.AAC.5
MKQPLLGGHPRGTHGPGEGPLASRALLSSRAQRAGSSPEQAGGLLESGRGGGRTGLRRAMARQGCSRQACGGRGGGGAQVSSISASRRAAGALSRSVAPSALVSEHGGELGRGLGLGLGLGL